MCGAKYLVDFLYTTPKVELLLAKQGLPLVCQATTPTQPRKQHLLESAELKWRIHAISKIYPISVINVSSLFVGT